MAETPKGNQASQATPMDSGPCRPGTFEDLKGMVTLTGVGFWDLKHG